MWAIIPLIYAKMEDIKIKYSVDSSKLKDAVNRTNFETKEFNIANL